MEVDGKWFFLQRGDFLAINFPGCNTSRTMKHLKKKIMSSKDFENHNFPILKTSCFLFNIRNKQQPLGGMLSKLAALDKTN